MTNVEIRRKLQGRRSDRARARVGERGRFTAPPSGGESSVTSTTRLIDRHLREKQVLHKYNASVTEQIKSYDRRKLQAPLLRQPPSSKALRRPRKHCGGQAKFKIQRKSKPQTPRAPAPPTKRSVSNCQ